MVVDVSPGTLNERPESGQVYPPDEREVITQLDLGRRLDAEVHVLPARDVEESVVRFAREHQINEICLGRSVRTRWQHLLRPSAIHEIIRLADGIDVHVVADR